MTKDPKISQIVCEIFFVLFYIGLLSVMVWVGTRMPLHLCEGQRTAHGKTSVFFSYHVCSGDHAQVIRLRCNLFLLTHRTQPLFVLRHDLMYERLAFKLARLKMILKL